MRPRRAAWRAGGRSLVLAALVAYGRSAAAQTTGPEPPQRVECDREGPSRDVEHTPDVSHVPRNWLGYDLVLDIPRLCIEDLELHVDSLRARVSLDARIAGMVRVSAGASVAVDSVSLTLRNVRAKALLAVDLSHIAQMVDLIMAYLGSHPTLLKRALDASP